MWSANGFRLLKTTTVITGFAQGIIKTFYFARATTIDLNAIAMPANCSQVQVKGDDNHFLEHPSQFPYSYTWKNIGCLLIELNKLHPASLYFHLGTVKATVCVTSAPENLQHKPDL